MSQAHHYIHMQAASLRVQLYNAITCEFERIQRHNKSEFLDFDDYINVNVCSEVDRELDVRITSLKTSDEGVISACFEVAEVTEMKPIGDLTIDTLLDILQTLEKIK